MIEVRGLSKSFNDRLVIDNLDLKFCDNAVNCIIGASGSGKTTFLNILSGALKQDSGEVFNVPQHKSFVFQEPRILPHKTVYGNMDFVLKEVYKDKAKRDEVIRHNLDLVELGHSLKLYPHELSGGMAQRLAIARAFSFPSEILFMDEAFKSLDVKLKFNILQSFIKMWIEDKRTVIVVTHEIDEALMIGDHIHIFTSGFKCIDTIHLDEPKQQRNIFDIKYLNIKAKILEELSR